MNIPRITLNGIALCALMMSASLTVFLFAESRNDPSLRIAALVSGTNLVATLAAIGSTILTGKDVAHPDQVPPGTTSSLTVTQTAPPIPPPPQPEVKP